MVSQTFLGQRKFWVQKNVSPKSKYFGLKLLGSKYFSLQKNFVKKIVDQKKFWFQNICSFSQLKYYKYIQIRCRIRSQMHLYTDTGNLKDEDDPKNEENKNIILMTIPSRRLYETIHPSLFIIIFYNVF